MTEPERSTTDEAGRKLGWKNGFGEGPDFDIRHIYDFIDVVERKPGVFIGEPSISGLWWALIGFQLAAGAFSIDLDEEKPAFSDFHDFVCQTLGLAESTPGWRRMLLDEHRGDERRAFDAFFELLRQFRRGDA